MLRQLSVHALAERQKRGDPLVLIDVREGWERQICTFPGSVHCSLSEWSLHNQETLCESKDCEIVVFCHHGYRSLQACLLLQRQGFTDVMNLKGGIDAWAQEVETDMPRY